MKKVILILIALAVLALILSVCGSSPEPVEAGIPAFESEMTVVTMPVIMTTGGAVYRVVDLEMGTACYVYVGYAMQCFPLSELAGDEGR